MKALKISLLILFAILLSAVLGGYVYWNDHKPHYSGNLQFKTLQSAVDVHFDTYGIPHIYADNEEDAFRALGYVHAQERLFQMELLRRVGSGRLAEIFGHELLEADKLFRTFGLQEIAEESAKKFLSEKNQPYQKAVFAYLEGINEFMKNGKTPIEFHLLNIPKEEFTPQDCYLIIGYMAFSFSDAFRVEPVLTKIKNELGERYFREMAIGFQAGTQTIPTFYPENQNDTVQVLEPKTTALSSHFSTQIRKIADNLPVPIWIGSNSWVIAPQKTASGKVIFENDTHIHFGQPAVWYEAHIECPNWRFYGNWLAGFPFALVGHNQHYAWGLTMFENDDIDMFEEKQDDNDPHYYWYKNARHSYEVREETIKIKSHEDTVLQVRSTVHGPIINDLYQDIREVSSSPVALWWTFLKVPSELMQVGYELGHGKNMADMRKTVSKISAPGVNVMYGDAEGNIAWWAAAKLIKRPEHVNPNLILEGASGNDDPIGWYDFSENPHAENPPWGFVYSANNQPDTTVSGRYYAGYYLPEHRAKRIQKLLEKENAWTVEKVKKMTQDDITANHIREAHEMVEEIAEDITNIKYLLHDHQGKIPNDIGALKILEHWNGNHALNEIAPVIFYKLKYYILKYAMADEIGEEDFDNIINSHLMLRTASRLMYHPTFIWWDDVRTSDFHETRHDIFLNAFKQTLKDLEHQFGDDMSQWKWGEVHTLEHEHPIGKQKPFHHLFNVGQFSVTGGKEVINNLSFYLNSEGKYPVKFGSAMRIIIDFADLENSVSILPTGQSGNIASPHYDDQAILFTQGKFRKQMMNKAEILQTSLHHLQLLP